MIKRNTFEVPTQKAVWIVKVNKRLTKVWRSFFSMVTRFAQPRAECVGLPCQKQNTGLLKTKHSFIPPVLVAQ